MHPNRHRLNSPSPLSALSRLRQGLARTTLATLALAVATTLAGVAPTAQAEPAPVKLQSLRQGMPLQQDVTPSSPRQERDSKPLERDFVQQPPLVPHTINGYTVTKNFNKCMDCHAWARTRESGATKVSVTHFRTRENQELDNISPRRYFCTQCHVPQTDARPLVENTFQRARGMQ